MTCLVLIPAGDAQSSPRPTFEVASVKPNPNCRPSPNAGPLPGRLELPCITARMLIQAAYGGFTGEKLNARYLDAVGGPGWLDTEWYQVSAKAQGKPSVAQMMGPMLQALLEDRFQLKAHMESRQSPVYALTVARTGKLVPTKEGTCVAMDLNNMPAPDPSLPAPKYCGGPSMKVSAGGLLVLDVPGVAMEEFAGRLLATYVGRPIIDRPVVDRTGLTGRFDIHLEFAREATLSATSDDKPSIFVALTQQLGLKLSSDKAPIDVIVVESVAKPTAN
jgi:uncharacterized protein (TIGR03435 family)